MPNLLDYIAWRGDLTLAQDPLNENDELVLSQFSYVAFGDRLPGIDALDQSVPLGEAAAWLLAHDAQGKKIHQTGYLWEDNLRLLRALQDSPRFASQQVTGYVENTSSQDEKQFAAMTLHLTDGSTLVAFRGTDDTLVGWKEDLNMVFSCPIPAQQEALDYLRQVAAATSRPLRLCGHSKGGNLAVYAASWCEDEIAERILSIASHDGPGQSSATINSAGYARIRDRLRVYIPHFSFVGMLLEHESNYKVVQSDAKELLQHDAFSWQLQGTKMLCEDAPSERSLQTNQIIRQWIATLGETDQRLFIDAVYEIAEATYGDVLPDDVERIWPTGVQGILSAMLKLEPQKRGLFQSVLGALFSTAIRNIRLPWHRDSRQEHETLLARLLDTTKPEGE